MAGESNFSAVKRLMIKVLLVDLILFVFTALVCWFAEWRTQMDFGTGLVLAGVAAIFIGISTEVGRRRNQSMLFPYSMPATGSDRTEESDRNQRQRTLTVMASAGIVAIASSFFIHHVILELGA
ncbi:MAG: hypothetical protein GY866_13870 [Proteobacteria bacterium]|nr:hypothetical protein [Pseudomonadota bacterium]